VCLPSIPDLKFRMHMHMHMHMHKQKHNNCLALATSDSDGIEIIRQLHQTRPNLEGRIYNASRNVVQGTPHQT